MHKSILLAIALSCSFASTIDAKKKDEPAVQIKVDDDFELFEQYIDVAFEKGALDKPIEMKPPSRAEQLLRTAGVWLGMKFVVAKKYVQARWKKLW